jgi:hypothetical protein
MAIHIENSNFPGLVATIKNFVRNAFPSNSSSVLLPSVCGPILDPTRFICFLVHLVDYVCLIEDGSAVGGGSRRIQGAAQ